MYSIEQRTSLSSGDGKQHGDHAPGELVRWLWGPLGLVALDMALGWSDRSTEITPSHDGVLNFCFALSGLGALGLASVAVLSHQKMKAWRRIYFAICLGLVGFLSVFLLSSRVAHLVQNYRDFPASSTRTFTGNLLISRAYATHGKGQSWSIQTMPIWSNLSITKGDYQFMLDHRRPGDPTLSSDEISSKGYFCAQVKMQQSGNALRVLNAGSNPLPSGTIVLCPASGSSPHGMSPR